MSKKKGGFEDAPKGSFNNPFSALKDKLGELPVAPEAPAQAPHGAQPAKAPKGPARAVVRYERKGHGGKEVTIVEQLDLSLVQREQWLKALKASLGCGGRVDGDDLVLQGDQRERLPKLLEARGVRKVSVG